MKAGRVLELGSSQRGCCLPRSLIKKCPSSKGGSLKGVGKKVNWLGGKGQCPLCIMGWKPKAK